MKKSIILLLALLAAVFAYAQAPQGMSYQAVIRNASGSLVPSSLVGIRISIVRGSPTGSVVYSETHSIYTNANGLATLEIGSGAAAIGSFATIDWTSGPYFLNTQTDPNGGTNYTISTSAQLLSVPYALYAERGGNTLVPGAGISIVDNVITNTGDLNPGDDILVGASAGGDLTGAYPAPLIANNAVNSAKIADGSVAAADLANNAVTTAKIADGAVIASKLADNAVTSAKIADGAITNVDISASAGIGISKIHGDAGLEWTHPTNYQSWAPSEYGMKTMATITVTAPTAGYVLLTHSGYGVFFSQGRTMSVGVGTTSTNMITDVNLGYLDGSSTNRFELPYSVSAVVSVGTGTHTFYALCSGNSTFKTGSVNMVPSSFTGVFIPKHY
jgi:hypothetical protein